MEKHNKFLIALLAIIMCISTVFAVSAFAETDANTGAKEIYFAAGTDAETAAIVTAGGAMGTFDAQDSSTSSAIARKLAGGESVTYQFDLDDTLTTAKLKVFGRLANDLQGILKAEYAVGDGEFAELTLIGQVYKAGIYHYDLTEENALSGADNTFKVKLTALADTLGIVGVYAGVNDYALTAETITINTATENHLKYFKNSSLECVYVDNGNPIHMILDGGYVTYEFDAPDTWGGATVAWTTRQATINATYIDANNPNGVAVASGSDIFDYLNVNTNSVFQLKFAANSGNAIAQDIVITKTADKVVVEEPVPEVKEIYFAAGTEEETAATVVAGGTMGTFDAQDSSTSSAIARKLAGGESVTYQFDLDDTLTTAKLKLFGRVSNDLNCIVKTEYAVGDGEFAELTLIGQAYKAGVYHFDLTEENALSGADNTFKVKFTALADTLGIVGVYAGVNDYALAEDTITINTATENHLKYFKNSALECVYVDNNNPIHMILNGGYVTYEFDAPDTWADATVAWTVRQATVTATYIDANNPDGVAIANGGSIGQYLENNPNAQFQIKLAAPDGNAIAQNLVITKTAERALNQITGAILYAGSEEEAEFIVGEAGTTFVSLVGEGGGATTESVARLLNNGESITYKFAMFESITKAELRLFGKLAKDAAGKVKVEYSLDGVNYNELAVTGSIYNVGTYVYALTEENVFANPGSTFYIKVTALDDGLSLAQVYIGREKAAELTGDNVVITSMSDNSITHFAGNSLEFVFANNGALTTDILKGGYIAYYFDLPDAWENATFAINVLQGTVNVVYEDGENTVTFTSATGELEKAIKENATKQFTLKVVNAGENSLILDKIEVAFAKGTDPTSFDNLNTEIPENEKEIYFAINTEKENNYKYYNSEMTFDQTHGGLGQDTPHGGWGANKFDNARKLAVGEYLAYDFDLVDDATTATLKLYASAAIKVEVSADNGENYTELSAKVAPYNLGYFIYELTEADALANDGNTFRVKISATSAVFFEELYIATEEAVIDSSVYVFTHNEAFMRHFVEGALNHTYVNNGTETFIILVGKDKFVTFKFNFAEGVVVEKMFATLLTSTITADGVAHTTTAYYSVDNENWTEIGKSVGTGGTPPTTQYDLELSGTVYVKFVADVNQGFVRDFSLQVKEEDAVAGSFVAYSAEESTYAESLTNTLINVNENKQPVREIQQGQKAVYRFDLTNEADRVQFNFNVSGGYVISVSADGEAWETLYEEYSEVAYANIQTVNAYDVFVNNDANIVYVKLEALDYEGSILRLLNFSFTTENVPDKPVEEEPDDSSSSSIFDYEDSESSNSTTEPTTSDSDTVQGSDTAQDSESETPQTTGCFAGMTATAFIMGIILPFAALVVKRKKQ